MKMTLSGSLFMMLVSSLILAQSTSQNPETKRTDGTCFPVCDLVKELGAMREKQGAMETRLKESESQIVELKSKETPRVAFTATSGLGRGGAAIGPYNWDTTLVFRRVISNMGNGYNVGTGVFTAPVAGNYYFYISHHAGGEHRASLTLIKNNELIVQTYDHASTADTADNGSNAAVLQLVRGDRVYVRLGANTHVWGGSLITTFSGFLLGKN
ncbi:complement C1q tumor necrosis factor-related protein 3-like [Notolabrus celidotus]|uniref:complement C1q tumor necrosis factor-related protein 3-like n=1 Tax=Notolabrus celidotus TaxID=1203425 RepID=UPI00148F9AD8|nr:complement C1q tumor necrosis factor-related protein 3-like [Notolabrus celidotus]